MKIIESGNGYILEYKSLPDLFNKEFNNIKRNTVRIVNIIEDKYILNIITEITHVKIINSVDNCLYMYRKITDITRFESHGLIIYIFSW